jgi:ssDNA-binding Zn-finger/Zn-ribbon topoisomerase 1
MAWNFDRPDAVLDIMRTCEACGRPILRTRMPNGELMSRSVFLKRKFCNKTCMSEAFTARPVKEIVQHSTAHRRARRLKAAGPCERCGNPGRDVHHRNGNWLDNDPGNLERLCRPCHLKEHRGV